MIDQRPPPSWGETRRTFKTYNNILSVRVGEHIVSVFTRILSAPNPLRGTEFSWYWLDETRDTPQNTHDVVLSRMRESDYVRGLITTTPNGEDWCYERFTKKGNRSDKRYGSLHVPTIAAVRAGTITQAYYDSLRASYSPLMAAQELEAQHVNIEGGQAYYAAGVYNKRRRAPWGATHPDPEYPLIVGCDFNFSPSPMVWVVMQEGPPGPHGEQGAHLRRDLGREHVHARDDDAIDLDVPRFLLPRVRRCERQQGHDEQRRRG